MVQMLQPIQPPEKFDPEALIGPVLQTFTEKEISEPTAISFGRCPPE
jgi:hypothetical protein